MSYEKQIRKLARSYYYQNLYSASKDLSSLQLFDNNFNFSGLQIYFIFWVQVYAMLFEELAQKKWKWLDDEVIDNDERCDAFLYWRKQENETELRKLQQKNNVGNLKLKNKDNVTSYDVNFT